MHRELSIQQFDGTDGRFFLLENDISVSRAIKKVGRYQARILRACLDQISKGDTVLDIGANLGPFTIPFAKAVGDKGIVHAFEPQRIMYQMLCGNACLNGLTNIYAHNCGLSDTNEIAKISTKDGEAYSYFDRMPFSHCMISDNVGEEIELRTLDSFQLSDVAFIKIDVELHELYCLNGTVETITRCRPTIIIELYRRTDEQKMLAESVNEFMKKVEYEAEPIMRANKESRDTLFKPAEKCI